jgi:hypothetical protein
MTYTKYCVVRTFWYPTNYCASQACGSSSNVLPWPVVRLVGLHGLFFSFLILFLLEEHDLPSVCEAVLIFYLFLPQEDLDQILCGAQILIIVCFPCLWFE